MGAYSFFQLGKGHFTDVDLTDFDVFSWNTQSNMKLKNRKEAEKTEKMPLAWGRGKYVSKFLCSSEAEKPDEHLMNTTFQDGAETCRNGQIKTTRPAIFQEICCIWVLGSVATEKIF